MRVLERSTEVGFSLILSIYKVVYIIIKYLHAGYLRQRVGEICCQICQKLNYITPLKTANMPPMTLVNAWPSWIDARRRYILPVVIVHVTVLYLPALATDSINNIYLLNVPVSASSAISYWVTWWLNMWPSYLQPSGRRFDGMLPAPSDYGMKRQLQHYINSIIPQYYIYKWTQRAETLRGLQY